MNERDLRTAFEHLKEDVIMSVQTEERLEQITTRRSPWLRPAITAFAGAAAVAIVIGGVVLALRPTADPVPPATTVPSTTVVDATTTVPPTTAAPGPTLPDLPTGTALVAAPGATLAGGEGVVVVDAATAIADGEGGLVVQRSDAIVRIGSDLTETVLLEAADLTGVLGPSVTLNLEDLANVAGAQQAVVVVRYGQEYPDVFQEVWLLDLSSGGTEPVYQMVAVESNITRVSVAADRMVLTVAFEGGTYFEYLDSTGQPIDVVGPYPEPRDYPGAPQFVEQAVLSPDGTRFVYLETDYATSFEDGIVRVDLIEWDLASDAEVARVQLEVTDGARPGRMDYDGASVLLGRYQDLPDGLRFLAPLRLSALDAGTITELEAAGSPSIVK